MKKMIVVFAGMLIISIGLKAQTEILTKEDLSSPGERIIYHDAEHDYYGVVKNGSVSAVFAKDKKTGQRYDVVYNGKSMDGKMTETESSLNSNLPAGSMAKPVGGSSGTPKCKGYQKYPCEIIVGRDPATGTTITKQGECVKEIEVNCPNNPAKNASNGIKSSPVINKSK